MFCKDYAAFLGVQVLVVAFHSNILCPQGGRCRTSILSLSSYETQSVAVAAIAPKIGCLPETLRVWVWQAEKDSWARDGATSAERNKIKELEREVRQLLQANEILRKASAYFAQAPLAV
jgi:transposase